MPDATVTKMLDFDAWLAWLRSSEAAWLILLILPVVVAVVALWSRSLKPDRTTELEDE